MEAIMIIPRVVFLSLLFFLVIYRAIATLFSSMNIILYVCGPQEIIFGYYVCHGEIKSSDVACVLIWISVTFISGSLVWDIIKKGFGRSAFKDFHKILSLLSIISYEVWMFGYIYHIYVTEFDWNFKVIIFSPLLALLAHSMFQAFLSYDEYVLPTNEQGMKNLVYFIATSFSFNGIMTIHVLCMFVTALKIGISKEENFTYTINVAFLGFGEMMYRTYVMYKHFEQLINQYIPYKMYMKTAVAYRMQEIRNNDVYSQAELESRYVNLNVELVTGLTQERARETSYLTAPIVATFAVAAVGVLVAGNI